MASEHLSNKETVTRIYDADEGETPRTVSEINHNRESPKNDMIN
jgi:hypothetical protein